MLFDIRGDKITFNGYPFAVLGGAPFVGAQIDAERALLDYQDPDGMVNESDHYAAVEKAEKEGYDNGHADGLEAGAKKCENENRDKWEEAAAERALADCAIDSEMASQVQRVAALILALKQAHDALHAPVTKRYPTAKIRECKDAMRSAMTTLRLALNAYNAPNEA